ncbi:helix-turn-helix transcriptional regulator [Massilia sp.]|uniref:helix-turn-helix transcriptional regulator n=1 Tax=Massilia sp. TaxID=1882437 RepID=UPI00352EEA1F
MTTDTNSRDRMIKLPEVISMTGLSRSSIYLLIKKGNFPPQIKLSTRSSGWLWREINSWLESRPRGSKH